MKELVFQIASSHEHAELFKLINSAYRDQHVGSWTNEATLVEGLRITEEALLNLILGSQQLESSEILYVARDENHSIVGCIALTVSDCAAEIGTFAVNPDLQNCGYGKRLLEFIESRVESNYSHLDFIRMWVLSQRVELIHFYQRRGYEITTKTDSYPVDSGVGQPIQEVHLVEMLKQI